MKKVVTESELTECLEEAVTLLCSTVKKTLGPRGSNAIIDHSLLNPFITNDGVTIAKNIESEDERINTILTLAKEASIKTDETVGDGTTSTLVLLESIFNNGLQKIKEGKNPYVLKKELDEATLDVIDKIKKESKTPKESDYYAIASIAANDDSIGGMITSLYLKLKNKGAIRIEETNKSETYQELVSGYTFDTISASPYFLKEEVSINNAYILIANKEIDDTENLSEVINFLIDKKTPALILAKDYDENVINEVLSLNFNKITNVTLLKLPEYGPHQMDILTDLLVITDAQIVNPTDEVTLASLGRCSEIKIDKETVTISFNKEKKELIKHITNLKKEQEKETDEYELDFLNNRLSKLTEGRGIIRVGARTLTEAKEKKMRFDDALHALENTSAGILPGSGIMLCKISDELNPITDGYEILKLSLNKPFFQILETVGLDQDSIYKKIKENNYELIYNILEEKFESLSSTKILDPTSVVISSLENASSIAGMLLTTSSLIINENTQLNINIDKEL